MLLVILALSTAAAIPPRQDINPALLYLHAFTQFPELDESESMQLGRVNSGDVTAQERELAARFDAAFELIVRARSLKTLCDWGVDLADGPKAIVPSMRKIRTAANAVWLRARVALADDDQARARDELLAVSVMSRHAASDASLVATMIQVATEMRILDFIAAHFDQLKPQTRSEFATGLNALPRRSTVADAMVNEKASFCDWLVDKLETARTKERDDAKILDQFRSLIGDTFSNESDLADRIIEASGGTSAGVVRYIKATDVNYKRADAIAKAPASEVKKEIAKFETEINSTTNLLIRVVMPNVGKARLKELDFQSRLASLPNAAP